MIRERKTYDKAFKHMAVELLKSGKSSSEIGRELGLGHDTARKWKYQLESRGELSFPGKGNKSLSKEELEIVELKKKLRDAELERDILKKAVGIFSKSDGRFTDL
jgi:transposase